MKNSIVAVGVMVLIGYLSPATLLTTLLFAVGVIGDLLVRSTLTKEGLPWPTAFHKGCSSIHWAFVSLYVFSFDRVRRGPGEWNPIFILLVVIIVSGFLYLMGGYKTRQVLAHPAPHFLKTKEERENAALAIASVSIAIIFARVLILPHP